MSTLTLSIPVTQSLRTRGLETRTEAAYTGNLRHVPILYQANRAGQFINATVLYCWQGSFTTTHQCIEDALAYP